MKCAKPFCVLFLLATGAATAGEPRWAFAMEAPFAGAVLEYAVTRQHRVGLSYYEGGVLDETTRIGGARYQLVTRDGPHHGEFGLGVLFERKPGSDESVRADEGERVAVVSGGYRYEPVDGGVQLRVGLAWHYGSHVLLAIVPLPYASVGWTF